MNSDSSTTASRPAFGVPQLGLIAIIALVIAALTALDLSLARTEEAEMQRSAERNYSKGLDLLRQGKTSEAVEALRTAHGLDRDNKSYTLSLIEALMAAGKLSEADPLMNEIRMDQPNDGRANLVAARLSVRKGKTRDAEAYYHRAIYGEWPADPALHRIAARLELIDFLKKKGNQEDVIAELIPLQEEAAGNPALQAKVAQLFLQAGSPSRAADLYRSLIQHNPKDAAGYAGLGEADLQLGDYRAARSAFLKASQRDSRDSHIRDDLELSNTLAALDPTVRQLRSIEKYRRSLRILELARSSLAACVSGQPAQADIQPQSLLSAADKALAAKTPALVSNEMAENVLDLAGRLWQARLKICGSATESGEEPLRLIMIKLAQ